MNKSTIGYAIWIFALLLLGQTAQAQYGFGTKTPNKATVIEMKANDKGLLIPRVALTDTETFSPITGAFGTDAITNSLLVYNTATTTGTNAVTPGFYYWVTSKTRWKRIVTGDKLTVYTQGDGININASNEISSTLGTAIESSEIVNGTIAAEDLNQMGATSGQVLAWDGTTWVPADDNNTTYTAGDGIGIDGSNVITADLGTSIESGEITTAAVTTTKINSGGNDLVLTTSGSGTVEWMSKAALVSGSTTSGDVSSDGTLTVTDGSDATLKNVSIAITPGTANQVLTTTASGTVAWNDMSTVVQGEETLTVLGYDNTTNELNYKDENGTPNTLDLNEGTVSYDAATNEITYTNAAGTATTLILNNTSLSYDNTNQELSYLNSLGVTQVIDLSALVNANETLTVLGYDNTTNELNYKDENGTPNTLDLNEGTVSYDAATNEITYTNAAGTATTLILNNTSLSYDNTNQELSYLNSLGVTQVIDLSALVNANETLTVLGYDNTTNVLSYQDENGTPNTLDLNEGTVSYDAATNEITYTNAAGATTTLILNNTSLSYDSTNQELSYLNSLGTPQVIDLSALVNANETLTVLGYNNTTNVLNYQDEDGTINALDLNEGTVSYDALVNEITYTDATGTATVLTLNNTSLSYDSTNQELSYLNSLGVTQVIDMSALVNANETLTVLGQDDTTTGDITYTDENNNPTTVDVVSSDGSNLIEVGPDGGALLTQTDIQNNINGADLTGDASIAITNGTGATLVATSIKVATDGITATHIATGAVGSDEITNASIATTDIATAGNDQVLTTDGTGNPTWVNQATLVQNNQTSDAVSITDGVVTHTAVDGDAQNFRIVRHGNGSPTLTTATAGDMYVDDVTGDIYTYNGSVWIQKTGTPKFFYMPSVIFNTTQIGNSLTRDLYQDYVNQFQGNTMDMADGVTPGMSYTGGLTGSTGAPTDIFTYAKGDLYYYISYYDQSVFANLSINANGILTYDIIGNSTDLSYMTIIFVVK